MNTISLSLICEGCLSADRTLKQVLDEECRKCFGEILDPLEQVNHPLSLCWECIAMLYRVLKFRKQVLSAHSDLVRYMLHPTKNLTSLSQLRNFTVTQDIYPGELKNEFQSPNVNVNSTDNSDNDRVTTRSRDKCETTHNVGENHPMFIKVEDDVDFSDGFYEEGDNDEDDIDLKTALKPDPTCDAVTKKEKKKKSRREKTADEFNDSDDEPLKLKKEKGEDKERKPRGRRKKENSGPKACRKQGGKREKPAGVVNNPRVERKLRELNVGAGQLEMVVLSWEEVEAERQKALASDVFTRHEYRCYDCVLGFNHRSKLENHMVKHQPAAGGAQCSLCGVRFRHAHALGAHRRRHRARWRCRQCGGTWSRAAVAADHFARSHGNASPTHLCPTCGHRETTLGKLRNHLKNHAERKKCELCGKTFRDRSSLRTHLFIHKGEKEYECPRCGKRFLFKKAMEVHLVTHDVSELLYCHQCDMNFKNRMSYYQHMKYNLKHIDPAKLKYACQLCDKRFLKASRLEEHNLAVHLKATPISCTVPGCSFACSSRPVLRTHVRMLHRNGRALRNHVCHTCGKTYTTKKTLEGHMRSHTGERPFHCQLCPSTFGYEAALYNHNKLVHLRPKAGPGRAPPAPWAPPPAPGIS